MLVKLTDISQKTKQTPKAKGEQHGQHSLDDQVTAC
jgi:hypothetical protein